MKESGAGSNRMRDPVPDLPKKFWDVEVVVLVLVVVVVVIAAHSPAAFLVRPGQQAFGPQLGPVHLWPHCVPVHSHAQLGPVQYPEERRKEKGGEETDYKALIST